MSLQAVTWAYEQEEISCIAKFVLVTMADYVGGDGVTPQGDINIRRLAARCNIPVKYAKDLLSDLERDRYIRTVEKPSHDCRTYYLNVPIRITPETYNVRTELSKKKRQEIMERDGFTCQYCGDVAGPFHIDHVHPVSRGGDNDMENLKVACATCNISKGSKTLEEWHR
jgi:hypothetical protein